MTATLELQPDTEITTEANIHAAILLACARASLGHDETETLARLAASPKIDWEALIALAADHGVLPLLSRAFERATSDIVPTISLASLRDHAAGNARRNLMLLSQVLRLIAAMRKADVRVLPYKGPLLAMSAYGDPSLRQCGDLDIIVPEADVPAARATLEACGYRPGHSQEVADDPSNATALEYHLTYTNHDKSVMVELHWQVVGRMFSVRLDPVDLWDRAQTRSIAGMPVQMLSPEDELLVLVVHGAKHYWTRLTWVCDIAQFLAKNPTIDWDLLLSRAGQHDARGMLMVALLLAKRLLGISIPAHVLGAARPAHHAAAHDLAERLFRGSLQHHPSPLGSRMQLTEGGLFESLMFHARTRDRWTTAMRYCFHRAFTPNAVDRGRAKLPRALRFMYYAVRPLRLLAKYGPWARRPSPQADPQPL